MRGRFFLLLAIVSASAVIVGCAADPPPRPSHIEWNKLGLTTHGFAADRYACVREATYGYVTGLSDMVMAGHDTDWGHYNMCMQARGYVGHVVYD